TSRTAIRNFSIVSEGMGANANERLLNVNVGSLEWRDLCRSRDSTARANSSRNSSLSSCSRAFARQPHIDRVRTKFDVVIPSDSADVGQCESSEKFPVMPRREEFLADKVRKINLPFCAIGEADIDTILRQR